MNLETKSQSKESSEFKTLIDIGIAMFVPLGATRLWEKMEIEDEKAGRLDNYNLRMENAAGGLMMGLVDFVKVATYVYLAVEYFKK